MARFPKTLADQLKVTAQTARASRTYSIKSESEAAQRIEDEAAVRSDQMIEHDQAIAANQQALDDMATEMAQIVSDTSADLAQLQTDLDTTKTQVNTIGADLDAAEIALATANNNIATVTTAVNGKNKNYTSDTAPTGTFVVGDKWYKTPGYSINTWNGSAWIATSDAAIATAKSAADAAAAAASTADGKAVAAQTAANNAKTTADNAASAAATADAKGAAAQTAADNAASAAATAQTAANNAKTAADNAAAAASTADGKAVAAQTKADQAKTAADNAQTSANSAATAASTADGKAVAAQNAANTAQSAANQAQTDATSAGSAASIAQQAAATADGKAVTAQNTANGKNKVIYSTSDASGANVAGDTWYKLSGSVIVAQWQGAGGTTWNSRKIDGLTIANIDAGTITVGVLSAARIAAGSIDATKLVVSNGTNLVYNGSAEIAASNAGYTSWTRQTTNVPAGYSAAWTSAPGASTTNFCNSPAVPIKPNTQYGISVWVQADKAGSKTYLEPMTGSTLTGERTTPVYPFQQLDVPTAWTQWTSTFTTGTAPLNTLYFRWFINHSSGTVTDSTFSFTGFTLWEMNGGKLIVDGSITANHLSADSVTAAKIKAGEITAAKLVTGTLTSASGVFGTIDASILNAGTINAARFNAGDIRAKFIEAGKITASDIVAGTLTSASGVFGTMDASVINAGTINAARFNAGDIRAKFIEAGKITASDIVAGTLTSASGVFGTVDASVINAGTLNAARLNASDIRTKFLAAGLINATEIVAGTLTSASGVFGTMDASVINAGTLNAARLNAGDVRAKFIEAGKITATDIVAGSLTSASGVFGAIDAGAISTGTLDAGRIAAGSLTAKHVVIGDQTNLLNDGSFDAPATTTPWTIFGTSNGQILADAGRSNTNVLRSNSGRAGQAIAEQRGIMLKAGDKFLVKASMWVSATTTATNDARVTVWYKDKAGASTGSASAINLAVGTATGWNDYVSAVFTVPAGTDSLWVQCNSNTTYAGNVIWDDIEVRRLTGATLIEDGAITTNKLVTDAVTATKIQAGAVIAGKIGANAVTANEIAANSVTAAKMAITDLTNFAPSYAESPTDWTLDSPMVNITTAVGAYDGRRFQCIDNSGAAKLARGPLTAVMEGDELYAEGKIYRTGVTTNQIYLRYYFYDKAGAYISGAGTNLDGTAVSTSSANATYQQIKAVVPATAMYARLCVVMTNATSNDIGMYNVRGYRRAAGKLLVDGTITATHLATDSVTSNAIKAQSVTANALESDLILSSRIVAGNPTGTRAEMTSTGFRAYASDGAGGSNEVVRLGTNTDDYFAIIKSDGTLAATINQAGGIGAPSANISDSLVYKGREMTDYFAKSPRGIVAWAQFNGSQFPTVNNGSEIGLFELAWVPDSTRMYAVHCNPLMFTPSAAMSLSLIARYTTNGTAPTVSSPILARDIKLTHTGGLTVTVGMHDRLIGGFNGSYIRVLFTIASAAGGNAVPFASQDPTAWVEDIGPAFPQNGVITTGGGTNVNPVATYEKYYTALSVRNYDGAGNLYTNGNYTTMYQGTSPAGYGKLKSMAFFQDMTADLSGATINDIQVYFYFSHWYNNAGGTAAIGVHGNTGTPPSTFTWGGGGQTMTSAGWPKPGGRWVSMPSQYWNAFKTGAYRGLVLGGGTYDNGTYEYYGIASATPQIYIRYTK